MTNQNGQLGFVNQGLMESEVRRLSREIADLEKQPQSESGVHSLRSKRMCRAELEAKLQNMPRRRTNAGGIRLV